MMSAKKKNCRNVVVRVGLTEKVRFDQGLGGHEGPVGI